MLANKSSRDFSQSQLPPYLCLSVSLVQMLPPRQMSSSQIAPLSPRAPSWGVREDFSAGVEGQTMAGLPHLFLCSQLAKEMCVCAHVCMREYGSQRTTLPILLYGSPLHSFETGFLPEPGAWLASHPSRPPFSTPIHGIIHVATPAFYMGAGI